jgi:hypothetical protein
VWDAGKQSTQWKVGHWRHILERKQNFKLVIQAFALRNKERGAIREKSK